MKHLIKYYRWPFIDNLEKGIECGDVSHNEEWQNYYKPQWVRVLVHGVWSYKCSRHPPPPPPTPPGSNYLHKQEYRHDCMHLSLAELVTDHEND